MKGHDYGELIDAFGLRDEYNEAIDALSKFDGQVVVDEPDAAFISAYIREHITHRDNKTIIDQEVKDKIVEFLRALLRDKYCGTALTGICGVLIALSADDDDWDFYNWFTILLPHLWT